MTYPTTGTYKLGFDHWAAQRAIIDLLPHVPVVIDNA